jgi:SAM-dependent methyltransferase
MRYVVSDYDDAERARLGNLAEVVDPYTFHRLDSIGIEEGWRCLEIGAGLGTVSLWLADRVGERGHVVCTDVDTTFISEIRHQRIVSEKLDILDPPTRKAVFDLIVVRNVHHHIPDRERAARHIVEMLGPGGHVLFVEPDIHPALGDFHPLWQHAFQAFRQWGERRDISYFIGRRLPLQLSQIGLDIVSVSGETPLFNGAGGHNPARDLYRDSFRILMPELIATGLMSETESQELFRLMEKDNAWLMSFCFVATHARKPVTVARS